MSWMKQRQGAPVPPPASDQHQYVPHGQASSAQTHGNQQNMYQGYQNPPGNPQQQYWPGQQQPLPQQQQQYNQYAQVYQQDYQTNANQFYPPQNQYNQNYNQFNSQQGYQQNYYPDHQVQPQSYPQKNTDGWEDNWDWGWDEASKQAQKQNVTAQQNLAQQQQQQQQQPPPPTFHNANVIEESFATNDTWNWTVEEKKEAQEKKDAQQRAARVDNQNFHPSTAHVPEHNVALKLLGDSSAPDVEFGDEVIRLSDKDTVKERLPNLELGKRFKLDNLTPQWSIESQMSQDSSDGPHTHSEGTFRSENQSRSSNKSSPGLTTENSNFNYSFSGIEGHPPWSISGEPTPPDSTQSNSRKGSEDRIVKSMQEMSLGNHENPGVDQKTHATYDNFPVLQPPATVLPAESNSAHQHTQSEAMPPPPPVSTNLPPQPTLMNFPPPLASTNLPPPSSTITLPRPPSSSSMQPRPLSASSLPRPSSSASSTASVPSANISGILLPPPPQLSLVSNSNNSMTPPISSQPPPNLPLPTSSANPFKNAGPFSHKSMTKPPNGPPVQFTSQPSNTILTSPSVVNKLSQQRTPIGFEANLETTPDNSERPDQPQMSAFRATPASQHVPENMEVAPRSDRNKYLQTAHLSSSDYGENTDFSGNAPPPGLRRMVVGQQESEYSQNLNISGEEPPPSFARMVPGQQNEAENAYNPPGENYMDRHGDGQPTDNSSRPYRQADGQQTPDNYTQPPTSRANERRPIGLDRMVPGEPSNDQYQAGNYPQYQGTNYAVSEQRIVTGFDHDFQLRLDAGPSDIREQNVDGSDYSEQALRTQPRNVIGARESNDMPPDYGAPPEEQQREVTMEGENLQDLSVISSTEMTFSREQILDGADTTLTEAALDRNTDASDSINHPTTSSRRQSLTRVTSGEDSERDRTYKTSPRKDKHKPSRERDKEKDRYSRDRKYEKEDRRDKSRRDKDRRERDDSPETRRHRRSARSRRYETEDTDHYSDRERERRRREGSYTSRPPRSEDKERERSRRHNASERDRRHEDEWDSRHRSDRHRRYRDIDPTKKYGSLRRRDDDRRRGETFSSPSRPDSREATVTDDDANVTRRRRRQPRDPYYDAYGADGYTDAYSLQRRQYSYYEQLRRTDPAAYLRVYKQLVAGHAPHYHEAYSGLPYEGRGEGVHSGRSSAAGLKGHDTYFGGYRLDGPHSLRDAPSLRTDASDRDITTDVSLNLHLEESTVRSERMTPVLYSTAHVRASLASRHLVVVRPCYPVDGAAARVHVLALDGALHGDPDAAELLHYPGPLVKGVSHKKSVIEYCESQARAGAPRDPRGHALLWDYLALLLTQNGVVVGSDLAELLMKNTREHEAPAASPAPPGSRRESSVSDQHPAPAPRPAAEDPPAPPAIDEAAALDKYREYLLCGNRRDALEWAVSNNLWGHALHLASLSDRRTRAALSARFLGAVPRADPLHTLYAALAAALPPAVAPPPGDPPADWRPHCAVLLANAGARPDHERRLVTQLGDSLAARGLLYSAQFCYLAAEVPFSQHPLAPLSAGPRPPPPRLSLLLADPRAPSLQQFATNKAIFATEIYEYAKSLNQDYVIPELQVYKLLIAVRLTDCGLYERALGYTERAARAAAPAPRLARALALLADRLKYHDPALQDDAPLDEGDSGEPSPRHQQWIEDVKNIANMTECARPCVQPEPLTQPGTPQHAAPPGPPPPWPDQAHQYQQPHMPGYPEPVEETPDYSAQYYTQPPPPPLQPPHLLPHAEPHDSDPPAYAAYGEDWHRTEEHHAQTYADPYWQGDAAGYGYGDAGDERPRIRMPGAAYSYEEDNQPAAEATERDTDTPVTKTKKQEEKQKDDPTKSDGKKGGGWLGGILTKLSLRPPNQMILPDDKNPTIVWDEDKKRWRNLDGDVDENDQPPPPPPKMADIVSQIRSISPPLQPNGAPPSVPLAGPLTAPPSNIFKMQKGRHIKNSYVDVFNPGGTAARPPAPAPAPPPPPAPAPYNNYFVPAPALQSGVYDPAQAGSDEQYRSGI
ncbi:uncharacterized protein LOC101745679 isoform X1 [Bombyx mori]|uniref:Sec16 Sec23-binding domain-containing protein n=1 Tax=Bombyx mori TaxID=7091 RepID=A0A8R2QY67_BOMMO|nr:uncharacterized protein LOC101745679 isoform X5 [Bombyx mori]